MPEQPERRPSLMSVALAAALTLAAVLAPTSQARAGKLSWMDEVVQQVVREAKAEGRVATRSVERSTARGAGRLFVHEADEGLEALAKRSDDLARAARRLEDPAEAALASRFARLTRAEPGMARTFDALAPAEKRLVVEMGETARRLARQFPDEAEPMIRKLGVEGMTAVRVYGDDVAGVIAREGPESVNVLRKAGRPGWRFYTEQVLRHKKKLAAAGVLALFLANPDQFVDTAGRVTEYAVRKFAEAGIQLAGGLGDGVARGLSSSVERTLGLDPGSLRYVGMALAGSVAFLALMVLLGLPIRWIFRPITWPFRMVMGRVRASRAA